MQIKMIHFEDQPSGVTWIPMALLNRFIRMTPDVLERFDGDEVSGPKYLIPAHLSGIDLFIKYVIHDDEGKFDEELNMLDATTIFILDVFFGPEAKGIRMWRQLCDKIDAERQLLFLTAYPAKVHEELNLPIDHPCIVRKPPSHTQFVDILCRRLQVLVNGNLGAPER